MEPLLRSWFAIVDRLLPDQARLSASELAPRWRNQIYGGDGGNGIGKGHAPFERMYIDFDQHIPPSGQRQLREAWELFALALRLDGHAFMNALAKGMPWMPHKWSYEPFANGEKLQVRLPVDLRAFDDDFFSAFLSELTDATASIQFRDTKKQLAALFGVKDELPMATFNLEVQLEILAGRRPTSKMTNMLQKIDRNVFNVTKVYVILSPDLVTSELVEMIALYRVIHTFRDTAEVETHFDLPEAYVDRVKLIRWKWFFDLVTRKEFTDDDEEEEPKHP